MGLFAHRGAQVAFKFLRKNAEEGSADRIYPALFRNSGPVRGSARSRRFGNSEQTCDADPVSNADSGTNPDTLTGTRQTACERDSGPVLHAIARTDDRSGRCTEWNAGADSVRIAIAVTRSKWLRVAERIAVTGWISVTE